MGAREDAEIHGLLADFRSQMQDIVKMQQQRVKLMGTASTKDKQITVTVNANGVVIDTKFGSGIGDYSYDDIAKAITRLAQQAAEDVTGKTQQLVEPLRAQRERLPKLHEVIPGLPDFQSEIPTEPPVLVSPPGSRDRDEEEMVFTDVVDYQVSDDTGKGVTDSVW
ncbi:YbaB/EbfC family nucleoid-associated protein [Nocardia sp. NPDC051832]|uniref:YbaB/EbfC family nucleoid-associated protein n=1 Tax=Nocardia sp. NPDC051832 TaxID=3155673 RepID=UPI003425A74C